LLPTIIRRSRCHRQLNSRRRITQLTNIINYIQKQVFYTNHLVTSIFYLCREVGFCFQKVWIFQVFPELYI